MTVHAGFRYLDAPVGSWFLLASATTPLMMMSAELAYLLDGSEDPDSALRLTLPAVPALALAGIAVAAVVTGRRVAAATPTGPSHATSRPD